MDRQHCAETLIARCSTLIGYHHRRAGGRSGQSEMREEFGWLAADARRWDVRPEMVAAGVLAELRRFHDSEAAYALLDDLEVAFGLERAMA